MRHALIIALLALGGCSTGGGPYPSLQPRAAEQIDPRLPVLRPVNDRPVTAALSSRLDALVAQAKAGDSAFAPAIAAAERLAAAAGAKGSESWTAAQEALSAAVEARRLTTAALGDIDAIAATALATQGGIAPNELAAIQAAAAQAGAIEHRQVARIKAIQARLGA